MTGFVTQLSILVIATISTFIWVRHAAVLDNSLILIFLFNATAYLCTLWLTRKHSPKYFQLRYFYIMAPFMHAFLLHMLIIVFLGRIFLDEEGRFIIVKSSLIYLIAEYFVFSLFVLCRKKEILPMQEGLNIYSQQELAICSKNKLLPDYPVDEEIESSLTEEIFDLLVKNNESLRDYNRGGLAVHVQFVKNYRNRKPPNMLIYSLLPNGRNAINECFHDAYNILPKGGLLIIRLCTR